MNHRACDLCDSRRVKKKIDCVPPKNGGPVTDLGICSQGELKHS